MDTLGLALTNFHKGKGISNSELDLLLDYYRNLYNHVRTLLNYHPRGDRYFLMESDIYVDLRTLEVFKSERER